MLTNYPSYTALLLPGQVNYSTVLMLLPFSWAFFYQLQVSDQHVVH